MDSRERKENIYIGLGSNMGARTDHLSTAIRIMTEHEIQILNQSSIYESSAWGYTQQPAFLNQVVEIATDLDPDNLLKTLKSIEQQMGRQKRGHWQEREIDLDIILYNQKIIKTPHLEIPHRWMKERRFVLEPLAEIAADFVDPISGSTIARLLEMTQDENEIYKFL